MESQCKQPTTFEQVPFHEYLEAKYQVDSVSINGDIEAALEVELGRLGSVATADGKISDGSSVATRDLSTLRVIDAGCGTGAGLRRLATTTELSIDYTGVDADPENRTAAIKATMSWADNAKWTPESSAERLGGGSAERHTGRLAGSHTVTRAEGPSARLAERHSEARSENLEYGYSALGRGARSIRYRFLTGDVLALPSALSGEPYHLAIAHSIFDLLPLAQAVGSLVNLLVPGGLLYSTINYNGSTSFGPSLSAAELSVFEIRLLDAYHRSMNERTVGGQSVGGSETGSKLATVCERSGLQVLGVGQSDWSLLPVHGRRYESAQRRFLESLLFGIAEEGSRAAFDQSMLRSWLQARLSHLESGVLEVVAHNIDLLGVRRA